MHAGVLSATRGQRLCTAKVLVVGVCPCAAANDVTQQTVKTLYRKEAQPE
jgi:hypothetical protein